MFGHIRACKQEDQPQKAYCKQHGIAYSTFQYWTRKYRKEFNTNNVTDTPPGFIPVKEQAAVQELSQAGILNQLRFLYPNGIQLMCSETIKPEVLKNLLNQ